jgi:hypothetical protein
MDGKRHARDVERVIAELAGRQHGVLTRRQLLEREVSTDVIDFLLGRRWLDVIHRGVYRTGMGPLGRETRWAAAVLAGGPGAVLSDRSAAALWCIHHEGGFIEVTVPGQRRDRDGVVFHRRRLPPDEIAVTDRIPVTSVPRTLLDLATGLRPRQLERALNETETRRLTDRLSLEDLLRRYPRRRGSRAIRALLAARERGATITRSELELRFLEFLDTVGLPAPETNVWVEGFEVDCLWRARRVAVELDGRAFHDREAAFERDRERDRVLGAADWRPFRVTWRQLRHSPAAVERDLRRILRGPPATLAA